MIFMDYRESLRGALETTYTDESGRPMLQLIEYGVFRYLASHFFYLIILFRIGLIFCTASIYRSFQISGLHMG